MVQALATLPDQSLLAGGGLPLGYQGWLATNFLYHLLPDGMMNPLFHTTTAPFDRSVTLLQATPAGQILVGGSFRCLDGQPRFGLGMIQLATPMIWAALDPARAATIVSPTDGISYQIAAGTFDVPVRLFHHPVAANQLPRLGGRGFSGRAFNLVALDDHGMAIQPALGQPLRVTINYADNPGILAAAPALWRWDSGGWTQAGMHSQLEGTQLYAELSHLSLFAVLGDTWPVYLPVTVR